MRKMKDSGIEWIGEIPENWGISKIKHHFKIGSGTTPKSDNPELWDGDIVWITPADFKTEDIFVSSGHRNLSKEGYDNSSLEIIPAGNIIFSKRAPIGQVVINKVDLCTNQGCLTAIPIDYSDVRFYRYIMSVATEEFELSSSGTTFKEISATSFGNIVFPLASIEEQRKVADYLDFKGSKIDAIIVRQEEIIEKMKSYQTFLISETVRHGLCHEVTSKDSGYDYIGEVPSHWEICRLRNIGIAQNGISKGAEFFGHGFPFVSYGDVYRNYSLPEDVSGLIDSTEKERELYSVKKGDIFFTRTSETIEEVGFSSVCEKTIKDACFAGFLIRVRPYNDKLDVGYAKYYFRSNHLRFYLVKEMNLVTRASLGQDLLKSMPVLVPPMQEQQEIARYLDKKCTQINSEIEKRTAIIEKLREYKKSLVYEVVTGKKEV